MKISPLVRRYTVDKGTRAFRCAMITLNKIHVPRQYIIMGDPIYLMMMSVLAHFGNHSQKYEYEVHITVYIYITKV